jgi:hypothetical protein
MGSELQSFEGSEQSGFKVRQVSKQSNSSLTPREALLRKSRSRESTRARKR